MPMSEAILRGRALWASRISVTDVANCRCCGYFSTRRLITSICSRVSCTASLFCVAHGTNADQNCAPTIPVFSLGRSVCEYLEMDHGSTTVRSVFSSNSLIWFRKNFLMFHGKSLWPSVRGTSSSICFAISSRSRS
ncbi:unnamed protein product [Spodoptera exigua]|nr:unnamed protein product [Spodoptera exigua]